MRNATRFALVGVLAGVLAPAGLTLYGTLVDRALDPLALFVVLVTGGVLVLGGAGWLLGRKDDQLAAQNRELQALSDRLQALSATDGLTGIPNRRALDERLAQEIARTNRYRTPLALVMVDLDHFKALNDRYGHQAGDAVLREFAQILDGEKRFGDLVARYGGEEFVAVLPHSDAAAALAWAERVRTRLASVVFTLGGDPIHVTASFGVAAARADNDTAEALLHTADEALYTAKSSGRNRVAMARPRETHHSTIEYGAVKA